MRPSAMSLPSATPSGDFCYEPVKDAEHVVALAGGSGITPFYSMAQAVADGTDNYALTIFYGARTAEDLIFKKELDALGFRQNKSYLCPQR